MSTYQCSVCFYICDLKLEVIEKFQTNNYRLLHWKKTEPFVHGNFRKFAPEFLVEWWASMDSEEHTRKRCFSLDHRTTNRQGNLWSLYQNRILLALTSFSLKYSSKCALKSLKRRGLAHLAWERRPNSNGSTILFSQIYPWNSDLLLPRKV